VVCKIEWHSGELFPRVGFVITNSALLPESVIKVAAKVSYPARRWHIHVSSSFPFDHPYRAVFSP
jgi:hypothetical protein